MMGEEGLLFFEIVEWEIIDRASCFLPLWPAFD